MPLQFVCIARPQMPRVSEEGLSRIGVADKIGRYLPTFRQNENRNCLPKRDGEKFLFIGLMLFATASC